MDLLGMVTGLPKWARIALAGVGAALLLGALWLWLDSREKADDTHNQEIGATVQREGDLRETIKRTEEGNETRETIRRGIDAGGSPELYAQCLRTARTPANCERFMRSGQADQR